MLQTLPGDGLYPTEDCRALDRLAMDHYALEGYTLMRQAAQAMFELIALRYCNARTVLVLCGAGNNGGDGFVLARLLRQANLQVNVHCTVDPNTLTGDAARAWQDFVAEGGQLLSRNDVTDLRPDLIVDALLGAGLCRPVEDSLASLIRWINRQVAPVLSVDVPSGLDATHGVVLGEAVRANVTYSFIGMKCGLLTGAGPDYAGEVFCHSLGLPDELYAQIPPSVGYFGQEQWQRIRPRRAGNSHKGSFGHVLVIGGAPGMVGAARMAGEAAMRVGAGLVTLAVHPDSLNLVSGICPPELMLHALDSEEAFARHLSEASVILVGPGLGQCAWAQVVVEALQHCEQPLVLDADALNILAHDPARRSVLLREQAVITPHPGEAARLLGLDSGAEIQADRFAAVKMLQRRLGAVSLLKGQGTLIADAHGVTLSDSGNPGMAVAGMGDVLGGVIAGLMAQGLSAYEAACAGAWLHGRAAEQSTTGDGMAGLMATDLMLPLRRLMG